jgi:GAF domain-containing protein
MRADFYPDLMNSDLWPVKHNQRLEIAPLRGEALRRAIEQPALDVGVHFQAELLEHLLADAADEPGVLPLLQETMVLLWDEITAQRHQKMLEKIISVAAKNHFSATLDLTAALGHIIEQIGKAFDVTRACFSSYEPETMSSTVLFEYFSPHASEKELVSDLHVTYPLPQDFTQKSDLLQASQPEVIHIDDPDINEDRRDYMEVYGVKTILNIPLLVRGKLIAFLELWENEQRREFISQEIGLCQAIAQQAAIALENARLYIATQQELAERRKAEKEILELNRKLLALQYAGAAISSSLDLSYVINTVTREMINLLDVEGCAISEWDQAGDRIITVSEQGLADWWNYQRPEDKIFKLADYSLTKQVLVNRQAEQMTISQADLDESELAYMQTTQIKTLLMLPMEFQDRVVGLVEVMDSRVERTFSLDELALAQQFPIWKIR